MKLSRQEIARYVGAGHRLPDALWPLADECEAAILPLTPRRTARRLPREKIPFASHDLDAHLEGCDEVFLTALTLGSECDRLLRLWSVQSMAKASVGQAVAACYMDVCCEEHQADLELSLSADRYLIPAFSPGYGDCSLAHQETLLRLLDANRRIGLSLTQGGMLVPEKSVTAIVGISRSPARRCVKLCEQCGMKNCLFRKGS